MPYIYQKHEKCRQFAEQTADAVVEKDGEKIIAEKAAFSKKVSGAE